MKASILLWFKRIITFPLFILCTPLIFISDLCLDERMKQFVKEWWVEFKEGVVEGYKEVYKTGNKPKEG